MGSLDWLIDGSGACWPAKTHPIAHWDDGACDPLAYAVSDLGFIHLRSLNGGMVVNFEPSRVMLDTLIAAFYVIYNERPKRVAFFYAGKCPEIVGTISDAFRRVEQLVDTHPHPVSEFSRKRRSLHHLPKPTAERIIEPLRAWNNAGGMWTPERWTNICAAFPIDSLVLVRNPCGTDWMIMDHWGADFDFFGPRWLKLARGKHVEAQPFLIQPTVWQYRRTLADREPSLDDIDVGLVSAGSTLFRRQFARLILPWSALGGDRYLTLFRFDALTA